MKLLAISILLASLYFLYRIAFPKKQAKTVVEESDLLSISVPDTGDVVGKSTFVVGAQSQAQATAATISKADILKEKQSTFAAASPKDRIVIPPEELDKVFGETSETEDLDLDLDDETDEEEALLNDEEEAEELRQVLGRDAVPSEGLTYEQIADALQTVTEPQEVKSSAAGEVLIQLQHTDLLEQLFAGDTARAARINAVLDLHEHSLVQETEGDETGKSNFDISNFL
jgi:hypothetical protein